MRIEQIQYLKEIDKTHSISLAAENLYVTQSAISNAIKKLEEELRVMLLNRMKHGVYLTAAGREIMQVGQDVLLKVMEIEQIAQKYQQQEAFEYEGKLTIETSPQFMLYMIPDAIANFATQYPQVMLEIYERNPAEIYDSIHERKFDLYFFLEISSLDDDDRVQERFDTAVFEVQILGTYKPYAYVGVHHPLSSQNAVTLNELLPYTIGALQYGQDDREHVIKIFGSIKPARILKTNSIYLLMDQIKRSQCIGIGPSIGRPINGIQKIPIRNNVRVTTYLCYAKDTANLNLIKQFLSILRTLL